MREASREQCGHVGFSPGCQAVRLPGGFRVRVPDKVAGGLELKPPFFRDIPPPRLHHPSHRTANPPMPPTLPPPTWSPDQQRCCRSLSVRLGDLTETYGAPIKKRLPMEKKVARPLAPNNPAIFQTPHEAPPPPTCSHRPRCPHPSVNCPRAFKKRGDVPFFLRPKSPLSKIFC